MRFSRLDRLRRLTSSISSSDFDSIVQQALDSLPEQFAGLLENVAVVTEEEPSAEDLELVETSGDELLGIYRGVALTERSHDMLPTLPDQIAIFRGPILRVCHTRREAVEEIRDTVIHELGHYFGLDDHHMPY